jgi:hypothetical protein
MRLSRTASTLARLAADLLLVLALLTSLLWLATRARPLSVDHESYTRGQRWNVSLRLAAARGGLWILHLSTRPPGTPVPLGLGAPHSWILHDQDPYDPDRRLSADQTGPRRFGFSTRLRQTPDRTYYTQDPVTLRPTAYPVIEQERITRLPFAAVVAAMMILPAGRLTLAARRRVARARRPDPVRTGPAFPIARRLFDLAALAAALLVVFAIVQWVRHRDAQSTLSWSTRYTQGATTILTAQTRRAIDWSPAGWEFSRASVGTPPGPSAPASAPYGQFIGFNLRDDLSGRGLPPSYGAVGSTGGGFRHLGFGYTWDDTSMGPVRFTFPLIQVPGAPPGIVTRSTTQPVLIPPTVATARRTALSLTLPHYAVVLLFATLPALWLLRFRHPLRQHLRRRRGLCPTCGYDLRATPTHCPECGAPAPHASPARTPVSGRTEGALPPNLS